MTTTLTLDQTVAEVRQHVLRRIGEVSTGTFPFRHVFIDNLFPADFYAECHAHMRACKYSGQVQDRTQDNAGFVNRRFNLVGNTDRVVEIIRAVFNDERVRMALLAHFYVGPPRELAQSLVIHEEFEYFFTAGGRTQNIHVDIPPKAMSFVFYLPETPVAPEDEHPNSTVLYDKDLRPHTPARFTGNSVCVFVPHFYTYHGFATTIDRDVLVMFFVEPTMLHEWRTLRQTDRDTPPFTGLLDAIEDKLHRYPLIEYAEGGDQRIAEERAACRVNAPRGRVLV